MAEDLCPLAPALRFTLSQLGQARRGSWCEVGVTQEKQSTGQAQGNQPKTSKNQSTTQITWTV